VNLPVQQNNAMQLPAHLAQFQSRKLSQTAAANIGTAAPPYISIQGNRFTLIDAAGNEAPVPTYDPTLGVYLDCVIFDINDHLSKVWYGAAFDPKAESYGPPACFSDNGSGPSRQAANPQSPICSTCPNAVWGSAISKVTGKGVKACHDQQKVAVYVAGFPIMFQMRIPPNSLKNFRQYAEQFNGQQFDMDAMITRISFDLAGVGTLLFSPISWIDQNAAAAIGDARAKNATDSLVGRTDVARDPNLPLGPAPQDQLSAPVGQFQQPAGGGGAASQVGQPQAMPAFQPAPMPIAAAAPPLRQPQTFQPAPQQQFAPAQLVSQTVAPTQEAPKQRRRRGTAAAQPAPTGAPQQAPFPHAGQPAPMTQPAQPTFQQQPQAFQPSPAPQAPAQPAPQPSFGMAVGAAPNPELSAMLQTAFGKPAGQ